MLVSCPVWVLGTKLESSVRVEHTDSEPSLQPLFLFLMGALELLFQWAVCVDLQCEKSDQGTLPPS